MTGEKSLVFVYGTLKTNQPNHHWLTNQANGRSGLISNGKTINRYPMVIGTRYNIPYLLKLPDTGHEICGEIYEIDQQMLAALDKLEDHPKHYLREQIEINGDDGSNYICWTYFLNKYPQDFLKDRAMINNYEDSAEMRYVKPSDRSTSVKPLDDLEYRP